jgi:L-seryl-tRNA(Ser) seleniumtransferase
MTLAGLEATLRLYFNEERALHEVPILRMLNTPLTEVCQRAKDFAARVRKLRGIRAATISEEMAYVGGGSLPDQTMKSWVVEVVAQEVSDAELAHRLRTGTPAVLGRLRDEKLVLDMRTIFPEQEPALLEALTAALRTAV